MGTSRKIFFILHSRRADGRLLINKNEMSILEQKILPYSQAVKRKIATLH
jgi:hypothetical protein